MLTPLALSINNFYVSIYNQSSMATREIITGKDHTTLRSHSQKVKLFDTDVKELAQDMHETLAATENGIGLAAPQVGVALRLFIIHPEFEEEADGHLVYVNPEITRTSRKEVEEEEGCLSLPGTWHVVPRSHKTTVKAQDEEGNMFKVSAKGLLARLFQHEVDHLKGTLFIDHLSN